MSEQQITEARERLNISVEGEANATVPLEAFDDMVSGLLVTSFMPTTYCVLLLSLL